jgi:hypothetical protein
LSVTVKLAAPPPKAAGVKLMLTVQLLPCGKALPQVELAWEKSLPCAPLSLTLAMVSGMFPVLEIVMA